MRNTIVGKVVRLWTLLIARVIIILENTYKQII